MRIVVIVSPTSIVVPSVMGYAKVNAIAATASATTTTLLPPKTPSAALRPGHADASNRVRHSESAGCLG